MGDVNAGVGEGAGDRQAGPWDASEADDRRREKFRIDLGGLVIRGVPGMSVRLEVHEAYAIAVTLLLGDSLVQLQAFTAFTDSSRWRPVRAEILENLRKVGKAADEVHGCLGDEVIAYGGAGDPEYPARFVGHDGPGWLLRGVFRGPVALDQDAAEVFERLIRDTIVVPDGQSRDDRSVFILRPPKVDRPIGPPRPPLRWVGGED